MVSRRSDGLDILRGFAILAMVLSSSIAFGILPGWMYHAQVPPPKHIYDPTLPGITWVDLVFPFFLFAMGAAFPLALSKRQASGASWWQLFLFAAKRYGLLVFFAIFTLQARAHVIGSPATATEYLLSLLGFVLLFFMYSDIGVKEKTGKIISAIAFVLGLIFLYMVTVGRGKTFDWNKSDVIIIVLGNMAFFGSLIWLLTAKHITARLAVLPFVFAIFIAGKVEGSWNAAVFNWTPAAFMYKFYYLKYLFIVLPGSVVGDWLLQRQQSVKELDAEKKTSWLMQAVLLAVIVLNTTALYTRDLHLNLVLSMLFVAVLMVLSNSNTEAFVQKSIRFGATLLMLGLFFEAYEGGVKKDPSTYSYYFITSGLAVFALLFFDMSSQQGWFKMTGAFLAANGRNPMVAYVAGNLLLLPILNLTGAVEWLNLLSVNPWLGFVRGIVFTSIVAIVTWFFTNKKWYWKT